MRRLLVLVVLLCLCLLEVAEGFQLPSSRSASLSTLNPRPAAAAAAAAAASVGRLPLQQSLQLRAAQKDYWEGEWICADCGFVYDKDEANGVYFEDQTKGFKCPQCGAPRRRFAKKVGEKVGITLDGGDAPILIFSFAGIVGVIAFGFWAANDFPGL